MRSLFLVLFIFYCNCVYSQALPPIQNFTPLDYNGENQNWGIAQGEAGHIYVANNHNLLEYDGVRWNIYKSPNASVFRSIDTKDSLLFTGQYLEFGFWERDDFGNLNYTSISKQLKEPMLEDEEFWNIVTVEDWVLFQSLDRIYSYNIQTKEFEILEAESNKAHIFKVEGTVYFQNQNEGIYRVRNGKPILVVDDSTIKGRGVVGIYKTDDYLTLVLDDAQILNVSEKESVVSSISATNDLKGLNVYCTAQLKDGSLVLGTISKGIFQINSTGQLIRRINQRKGLNNNTVLAVFQDVDDNLWLGLDNGLSVVNLNSPFNEYVDNLGRLGLVYTSQSFENNLYLGTNQGLFVKPENTEDDFKMIAGTDGQVWSLRAIDNILFCGHNKGTFLVENDKARLISKLPGTWDMKAINESAEVILQGNYDGLSTLKKENGNWIFGSKISGFDISSRFFEILDDGKILVNHEYKGLYELTVDSTFRKVLHSETHPIMGHGSSILEYQNKLIYASLDAAFRKEEDSLVFKPDTTLIRMLFTEEGGVTSALIPDKKANRFWCFTKKGLTYVVPSAFNSTLKAQTIPIPTFFRKSLGVLGFENLTGIKDGKYLIGISNGYVELDVAKVKESVHRIKINQVSNRLGIEETSRMSLSSTQLLPHNQNSVSFYYAVPQYDKFSEVFYQYRLLGLYDEWSPWANVPEMSFNNLAYGPYEFQVRAKVGNSISENMASYTFQIERPWYWSILAITLYFIGLMVVLFGVHRLYKSYYSKKQKRILSIEKKKSKRKKLKAEKELIEVRNDKLKSEIEAKNRELAVATMSMIKKNEFLNAIKHELTKIESTAEIKSVIRTIDKSITNEDDWKFFEKAFNNADKEFLKKIRNIHPALSPNDLKLCAYLRLNLTSKEIAPLLNISVRSVEVKRYRLRKKLDLSHESSLTKYIMEL